MDALLEPTWLLTLWFFLIAFFFLCYFVLEGFDFGVQMNVGALWRRGDGARGTILKTIGPVWDGNETWLIMGGGGLLAVFPLAYAVVMPALYVPLIVMLLALIFRGVAFEFRWR